MRFLLDTRTFIWWDSEPAKLSPVALLVCQDWAHTLLLSVASVWEMQIKIGLGKLTLRLPLAAIIDSQRRINHLEILPVELDHVLALENLPAHHKDPFDRLLIAQANAEGAILVSRDPVFAKYPINVIW